MESRRLIVGLGNPGREYADTRHNAGFLLVERLARVWGGEWRESRRFRSRLAAVRQATGEAVLCAPETYMNGSGEAVGSLSGFYRVPPERILVAVDDADLPLGHLRLRPEGSSGGHHGLESIEQHLGTRAYPRLRIGIGRRPEAGREITGFVLGRFDPEERQLLATVLERATAAIECWLADGIAKAMNRFNGAAVPPSTKDN